MAGCATILLGLALLLFPASGLDRFLRVSGGAFLLAAAIEILAAAGGERRDDQIAALALGAGGALSGFMLLAAAEAPLHRLNLLLIGAIAVRAISAGSVGMLIEARGRGWMLCRGLSDAAVGILLVVTMFAVLAALPFASLSTGFTKAQSSVSADLRYFIAASLVFAGGSQLIVVLCEPVTRRIRGGNAVD
ncbi:hypothetical protein [Sphingosinicella sp. BN140058]|uniref:hypothetical protein n=1 Tax=Sphingosinicella sp. BN140058 TaxID=1892855 RepID=UPI0010111F73|nr:hypothetical protein [Sphingosinicella sp. BN140058]QAY75705.1 hypothetical protein ETR14_03545 [Sphingosinicella sp. BN140058]